MTYEDIIAQTVFQEFPSGVKVSGDVKFEALAAEIIGTKQRRFGPMPSPETQVRIRDVIRQTHDDGRKFYMFFVPWGGAKQTKGAALDITEFYALKQLRCLQTAVERMTGKTCGFRFRVEDFTRQYLRGDDWDVQCREYLVKLNKLAKFMLGGEGGHMADAIPESHHVSCYQEFSGRASSYRPAFFDYLNNPSEANFKRIQYFGWKGTIPQEQKEYYYRTYQKLYPRSSPVQELAKYFSATLARVNLRATCVPDIPHVSISFNHPIPGDPLPRARTHYRTIPERFTRVHQSPWRSEGYFQIDEQNGCTPKFVDDPHRSDIHLTEHVIEIGGVPVQTNYSTD